MVENKDFSVMSEEDLYELDGGIAVGTAILIGGAVILLVSAGVSAYNGYQEAKRGAA